MAILRLNLDERNVRNLNLTNVVVVFDPPDHAKDTYVKHGKLVPGNDYLFLGEVKNMPGHGIFVDQKTGTTLFGYHLDNFYIQMEGIAVSESRNQYDETVYTVDEQEYEDVGSEDDDEEETDE